MAVSILVPVVLALALAPVKGLLAVILSEVVYCQIISQAAVQVLAPALVPIYVPAPPILIPTSAPTLVLALISV